MLISADRMQRLVGFLSQLPREFSEQSIETIYRATSEIPDDIFALALERALVCDPNVWNPTASIVRAAQDVEDRRYASQAEAYRRKYDAYEHEVYPRLLAADVFNEMTPDEAHRYEAGAKVRLGCIPPAPRRDFYARFNGTQTNEPIAISEFLSKELRRLEGTGDGMHREPEDRGRIGGTP